MQERIVLKAHELFMQYGIRSVSMDEIATQLGISKKTIYHYYADKDAIVDAVLDIAIQENMQRCSCTKNDSANAIHEVFLAVDLTHEMLKVMNPAIVYDLEKYHYHSFKKFTEHKNKFFFNIIKQNLERGIEEELYRTDINVELLASFRIVTMFLIFNPEFLMNVKANINEALTQITENFLYGIATLKGIKLIEKYKTQRQKNKK